MARRQDGQCGVCGLEPECGVRVYRDCPFIDGRRYNLICFTCYSVPKKWEYDKFVGVICYKHPSPYYLHTVDEMISDGWTRHESEFAIKAVKRALAKTTPINPIGGKHIFECLVLSDTIEIIDWPSAQFYLKFS